MECDEEFEQSDPRKGEDWKIQKRKGFQKDRENKNKNKERSPKIQKTKKRNSTEPLVPEETDDELKPDEDI